MPATTGRSSDGMTNAETVGFVGWAPETEAEGGSYTVAAVNAATPEPGKPTTPGDPRQQRWQA